ncbi:HAD family hydrolase [Bifidobacterium pseudolongum]|uniref:HAD family hydrolase n=1 Tax=Bifidobacterium pseudolongum TaxID=1694 RepID=UPI001021ED76|nr:HAD family phosphatase [Bifidobacterium pseudolongum]
MEHTAHTTPRYTDVMFDYCGVLVDWRPRRTIEGLYPAGVVDMFFDPADPHGVAYYDDLADQGWSEERIIADYEREHGPAVAWIMRLYFEFQRLGFYDMIDGMPTLMRDLHARGVRLWGLTNFTVRGVREMHGKYPWLGLLGGTVVSASEGIAKPDPRIYGIAVSRFQLDPTRTLFVDGSARNVRAACAVGLQAVQFESAAQLRALTLD